MIEYLDINQEVREALFEGKGVVTLESTIIAHGMPYPENIETSKRVEEEIRKNQCVPATVGVIKGRIKVGLTEDEILYLGKAKDVVKVSRRDLPLVIANKLDGATTVAGTMIASEASGIKVFVTGGIGGVHRGASETFDISQDLEELSMTDTVVVCAGIKSILDIGGTLEYLETKGVPVFSLGTKEFPAFYSRQSGFFIQEALMNEEEGAKVILAKEQLKLKGGMVIACPIPEEEEIKKEIMDSYIEQALKECKVKGKEVTPFLLSRIKELTEGKSLKANIALVINNAKAGGRIAKAYEELKRKDVR